MLRATSFLAVLVLLAGVGQAVAVPPISPYAQAVLDDNPIGYWRLGESSGPDALDLSGNGLHGTYAGGVTLNQTGAILTDSDTSALFDGNTGYVDVAPDSRLNKLTNNFTIEAWVRDHQGTLGGIIASNKGSFFSGYALAIDANPSRIHFVTFGKKDYLAPFSFPDDQWTYITVVFDSSNDTHFYVNGEFEKTVEGTSSAAPTSKPLYIGKAPYFSSSGSYGHFTGGLDEVAIYGRSLAPEEISEHYLAAVTELSTLVSIDIKPGTDTNNINLNSNGNFPVAIFSTDTFDATTVDPATIMLADAGVKARGKNGDLMSSFKDVDRDGLLDLLIRIDTQGLVLNDDDLEALLTGETFDGLSISGTDAINLVGSSGGLSPDAFTSEDTPLLAASAVPEPSTAVLLCMGAVGLAVFVRRKDPTKRT